MQTALGEATTKIIWVRGRVENKHENMGNATAFEN
jgi:hypothetical protein